jgi:hypothetical protein
MVTSFDLEARRLNAIREPLLYRIAVASLIWNHGRESVRQALIREAERNGVMSIALAPRWRERRPAGVEDGERGAPPPHCRGPG